MIDSIIPINFRLHNTTWVVAHFHTYLILCVVVWAARLPRPPARTRRRPHLVARRAHLDGRADPGRRLRADRHLVRRGSARRPAPLRDPAARHQRLQPRRRQLRAAARTRLPRPLPPTRPARPQPPGSGATTCSSTTSTAGPARTTRRASNEPTTARRSTRRRSPAEAFRSRARPSSASALAACVVALAAFFPQVVDASEVSIRYHHLDHAGQFFFGAMLGLLLGSLPAVSRRLGDHSSLGARDGARGADADDARDGAAHLRAARARPVRARALPPRDGRLRPRSPASAQPASASSPAG